MVVVADSILKTMWCEKKKRVGKGDSLESQLGIHGSMI